LNVWAVQVADASFKNIKQQMYEWFVQLQVLTGDQKLANDMLHTTYSVILSITFDQTKWTTEVGNLLKPVIEQIIDGKVEDVQDDVVSESIKEAQQIFAITLNAKDKIEELVSMLTDTMVVWSNKKKDTPIVQAPEDIFDGSFIQKELSEDQTWAEKWGSKWKDFTNSKVKKYLVAVLYAAGAAFSLYTLIQTGQQNLFDIPQDTNLGLYALGLLFSSSKSFITTALSRWIQKPLANGASKLETMAKTVGTWFTKDGVVLDNAATKLFGKSVGEFLAKRLGPALALVGIAVSSVNLYKAIVSGDNTEIAFEAVNTFFALADLTFIGLELAGFAWAGPVGVAFAVVGLLVSLAQLIYDIIHPPPPPPDPVTEFIEGPLKDEGWLKTK